MKLRALALLLKSKPNFIVAADLGYQPVAKHPVSGREEASATIMASGAPAENARTFAGNLLRSPRDNRPRSVRQPARRCSLFKTFSRPFKCDRRIPPVSARNWIRSTFSVACTIPRVALRWARQ